MVWGTMDAEVPVERAYELEKLINDAGVVTYIQKKYDLDNKGISDVLNKKSGFLGVSGVSSDFRDLEKAAKEGNDRAQLALDMFAYQGKKIIGSYAAAMEGVDVIVFTAGIGENNGAYRKAMTAGLEYMGVKIDAELNDCRGVQRDISAADAKVRTLVIPTNEELMIARETEALIKASK